MIRSAPSPGDKRAPRLTAPLAMTKRERESWRAGLPVEQGSEAPAEEQAERLPREPYAIALTAMRRASAADARARAAERAVGAALGEIRALRSELDVLSARLNSLVSVVGRQDP